MLMEWSLVTFFKRGDWDRIRFKRSVSYHGRNILTYEIINSLDIIKMTILST